MVNSIQITDIRICLTKKERECTNCHSEIPKGVSVLRKVNQYNRLMPGVYCSESCVK